MESELHNLVGLRQIILAGLANDIPEHTLLVTADGVEILTARLPNSPGGPVSLPPIVANGEAKVEANGTS